MTCILKLQKTHSKLYFSTHKNGLQQFEKSLLKDQKEITVEELQDDAKFEIYGKSILLSLAFFLVTPSKLSYKPSFFFRLSETKVVNVSVVNVEVNL